MKDILSGRIDQQPAFIIDFCQTGFRFHIAMILHRCIKIILHNQITACKALSHIPFFILEMNHIIIRMLMHPDTSGTCCHESICYNSQRFIFHADFCRS